MYLHNMSGVVAYCGALVEYFCSNHMCVYMQNIMMTCILQRSIMKPSSSITKLDRQRTNGSTASILTLNLYLVMITNDLEDMLNHMHDVIFSVWIDHQHMLNNHTNIRLGARYQFHISLERYKSNLNGHLSYASNVCCAQPHQT
jgi:hypothetical protein